MRPFRADLPDVSRHDIAGRYLEKDATQMAKWVSLLDDLSPDSQRLRG